MKLKTSLLGAAVVLGATVPALAQTKNGTMSNGTMSNGTMSNGTMSNGTMGNGTMGNGTMGNGTMGNGTMGNGTMGNGTMGNMNGSMMSMSAQDQLFMTRAGEGNLAEITFGQMATSKTRNASVKSVAQTIITGHLQAQNELLRLMHSKGMSMPPMLGVTHVAVQDALSKQKREGFDRMYMASQVDDHENAIALFQTEVMNGTDPDLKAYATKCLPDIVGHTIMIYAVARQVGAPGIQMRPMMPPIPPGVTPTMMGQPIDMSDPAAMMKSMAMGTMTMPMSGTTSSTMTPMTTTPVPTK